MKPLQTRCSLLAILLYIDLVVSTKTSGSSNLVASSKVFHKEIAAGMQQVDLQAHLALKSMVTRLLEGDGSRPHLHEVMSALKHRVNLRNVAQRLWRESLPADVMTLVDEAATHIDKQTNKNTKRPFSESSLNKAREVLNQMVEASQTDLDAKIIDCQTFKDANRGSFNQITADLARFGEQIADTERLKLEANNGITRTNQEIKLVKEDMVSERAKYLAEKAVDDADMRVKTNDLQVFEFILEFTKCASPSFLQLDHEKKQAPIRICQKHEEFVIKFGDKTLQQRYERMMTPDAQKELKKMLVLVHAEEKQHKNLVNMTTSTFPPIFSATVPVMEGSGESSELKCSPTPPDCGVLHDKMSLMWGQYKDQVDQLQHDMDMKVTAWEELSSNFQQHLKILTNTLTTYSAQLAEATASINADHEEQRTILKQKREVEVAYEEYMSRCKMRIEWILYQDICAIVVVRNAILEDSTVCPTAAIVDCDVEDWIPGPCSVSCDDSCPDPHDPFQCGGWQTLRRRIVTAPTSCGLSCPALTYSKKCNQIKCPVDCVMSEWSEYSKCTKDCESGVQQRTRDILTNAKNGGEWCEIASEARACNTGSCDRDCILSDWTEWSPCSMACNPGDDPGFTQRQREVVVPTRGEGKCPSPDSSFRWESKDCNTQACRGNEECFAVQDLVIAIDGSGSITADNFAILKEYVAKLSSRYKGIVTGSELMRMGIVQFGNGMIMEDGSISNAMKILQLTSDMHQVRMAIEGIVFLKGFTNMAQALSLSDKMLTEEGRQESQSAILTITDGRPSFEFQTQQIVDKLEEKGIQRYFITISEEEGPETDLIKKWATSPWYANHLHIAGFTELMATNMTYVQEAVVMFCPMSQSPDDCHAIAYQHGNFGGWRVDFPEGAYELQQMVDKGAPNDDMSAIKVFGKDCVATLYQHWDFSGYSTDYPEGIYDSGEFLHRGSRNDDISSLRVWRDIPYSW